MSLKERSWSECPKVSVVIPLYNKSNYIGRALDSVINQTMGDFEIIVVNDGSNDGGELIVKAYADRRIHLINQENQGVSAARNHGVEISKGELVAFLDADDEWLPEFLETIVRLRNKWPAAGIYSTAWVTYFSEKKIYPCRLCTIKKDDVLIDSPFAFYVKNGDFPVSATSVAIPKNIFYEAGGFKMNASFAEDSEFWARISLNGYPVACCTRPLAVYYKNVEKSITKSITLTPGYHPFQDTVLNFPKEKLSVYHDTENMMLYMESWYLGWALKMADSKKIDAIKYLKKVSSNKFILKKIIYFFIILIPIPFKSVYLKWIERMQRCI